MASKVWRVGDEGSSSCQRMGMGGLHLAFSSVRPGFGPPRAAPPVPAVRELHGQPRKHWPAPRGAPRRGSVRGGGTLFVPLLFVNKQLRIEAALGFEWSVRLLRDSHMRRPRWQSRPVQPTQSSAGKWHLSGAASERGGSVQGNRGSKKSSF